ncbi:MAG: 16S rRNA (guanine(527)-N(7))-methyltransferase RsmG [Bacilli bacterium]|nr:16S rRNA (guanine(527)-N(7))-methyltransferase RsmG [Bacilli bacterium]
MNKEELIKELEKINIKIKDNELKDLETYKKLLQENNKKFNLTTIIEENEINLKHFYDSLYLMKIEEVKQAKTILDIGTGAGFPGMPLAILNRDKNITLVESNGKKVKFLEEVKSSLELNNVEIINARAEDYAKNHREKYDIVTSRAVAHLKIIAELEIPCLKKEGLFLPLKANIEEELRESQEFLKTIGCSLEEIIKYTLPYENSKRTILKIRKQKVTNIIYPREYNKIKKEISKT